jgi:Chaperone of endosialidase
VTGANVTLTGSGGSISGTGNITAGNLLTSGIVSATANITGGNITTGGLITGNNNIVINAPAVGEGGQLVLAWGNTPNISGQANSTWNLDVDSSNNFRAFYQNAGGATTVLLSANAASNVLSFPSSAGISATGNAQFSANVFVGTSTATSKLFVYDAADRTQATAQFRITGNAYDAFHWLDANAYYIGQNSNSRDLRMYSGGSTTTGVALTPGNNAWTAYSDERLKDIIETIENATQKVSTLRTVIGKYKTDDAEKRRVFMIAQDVQAVLPEAVTEDNEGMLQMAYDHIVPLLTAAIKEQQILITQLTTRITALEAKL